MSQGGCLHSWIFQMMLGQATNEEKMLLALLEWLRLRMLPVLQALLYGILRGKRLEAIMLKWEYKRVFKKTGEVSNIGADRVRGRKISTSSCEAFDIDEIHEDLGSQGGELVSFTAEHNGTQLNDVFMRPIEG